MLKDKKKEKFNLKKAVEKNESTHKLRDHRNREILEPSSFKKFNS
jgi:hypothetical protein